MFLERRDYGHGNFGLALPEKLVGQRTRLVPEGSTRRDAEYYVENLDKGKLGARQVEFLTSPPPKRKSTHGNEIIV